MASIGTSSPYSRRIDARHSGTSCALLGTSALLARFAAPGQQQRDLRRCLRSVGEGGHAITGTADVSAG